MTNSEYKLIEHLDEAYDSLSAAAKIAQADKHPEAAIISNLLDALEVITTETWKRFRAEDN